MKYLKKSYAFSSEKMRIFNGHIKKETAIKHGFKRVTLSILDFSGKGRSENRYFSYPFDNMRGFS